MVSGYQEARDGAVFDERADRGRVRLEGPDARSFLHALVTNDVAALEPGHSRYAALLTPQGRMVTDMTVVAAAHDVVYLVVPAGLAASLTVRLDKSIFSEAVEVADVSASTAHFSVTGARARDVAAAVTTGASPDTGLLRWNSDELGIPGVDLIVPAAAADGVRQALAAAATALPAATRHVLRVEAGRPEFGVDMTHDTIPLEANLLDRAISTTKGCYVGQEVIIRVLHRGGGRVAKRLAQLRFEGGEGDVPQAGAVLSADGRDIGRVTSAVWSPRAAAVIGLGYVHRDVADAADEVLLTLADNRAVSITSV